MQESAVTPLDHPASSLLVSNPMQTVYAVS